MKQGMSGEEALAEVKKSSRPKNTDGEEDEDFDDDDDDDEDYEDEDDDDI